jgi:hypothetical protein
MKNTCHRFLFFLFLSSLINCQESSPDDDDLPFNMMRRFIVKIEGQRTALIEQEAQFKVIITPQPGYTINMDISPDALGIDWKPTKNVILPLQTTKKQADIMSAHQVIWSIPFQMSQKGEYSVRGQLRLGICGQSACFYIRNEKLFVRVTTANKSDALLNTR